MKFLIMLLLVSSASIAEDVTSIYASPQKDGSVLFTDDSQEGNLAIQYRKRSPEDTAEAQDRLDTLIKNDKERDAIRAKNRLAESKARLANRPPVIVVEKKKVESNYYGSRYRHYYRSPYYHRKPHTSRHPRNRSSRYEPPNRDGSTFNHRKKASTRPRPL